MTQTLFFPVLRQPANSLPRDATLYIYKKFARIPPSLLGG